VWFDVRRRIYRDAVTHPTQLALRVEQPSTDVPGDPRSRGAVYTPALLADWVAAELLAALPTERATIWDIACGDGALLAAVERAAPGRHGLSGLDIDEVAVKRMRSAMPSTRAVVADALEANPVDCGAGLVHLLGDKPDAIILNPPWGASLAVGADRLRQAGFELAHGQFDSYDVFAELALSVLKPAGVAALILPDSLFAPEHLPLRRLLLARKLTLLARLGEGFFPSVYRGTVVVTVVNEAPTTRHAVRCLRLAPAARKAVLAGNTTLRAAASSSHLVPQTWFSRNSRLGFEVDARRGARRILARLEDCDPIVWRDWLVSTRGVELSKHGRIVICPHCAAARPFPRRARVVSCARCAHTFALAEAHATSIIEPLDGTKLPRDWRPLIVGEDVRRYAVSASRKIQADVPGLAYKDPSIFAGPKLLVRKTGVGLNAAVDESGAWTTQVVFQYKPRHACDAFLTDYVAGVLSSRVLLAYYLQTRGESEWRSHPYVTQRTIEELPVPTPAEGTWRRTQAQAIAAAARARRTSARDPEQDFLVERLVCGLYEVDASAWRWTLGVLDRAQSLEGIKELRLPRETSISPLVVDS
jgi:hypothetical protein